MAFYRKVYKLLLYGFYMTTIVGLVADAEEKGIVLASDVTGTRSSWDDQGDVVLRRQEQRPWTKLYNYGDELAIGIAGVYDEGAQQLVRSICEGQIDFSKYIENSLFPELRDLNLSRTKGRMMSGDRTNSILLALRDYN